MSDYIAGIGAVVAGFGAYESGRSARSQGIDTESYYNKAADIQSRNADIARRRGDINYANAGIEAQWASYDLAYSGIQRDKAVYEARFSEWQANQMASWNEYMADFTDKQAAEYERIARESAAGDKEIAAEAEREAQKGADIVYTEKADLLRHKVAEATADMGRGGFRVNAGSFRSNMEDQYEWGENLAKSTKNLAYDVAATARKKAELATDTELERSLLSTQAMGTQAERYRLAGTINLGEAELARAGIGWAEDIYGIAEGRYGLAQQRYGLAGQAHDLTISQYGIDLAEAEQTRTRGRMARSQGESAYRGGLWGGAGNVLYGLGRLYGAFTG